MPLIAIGFILVLLARLGALLSLRRQGPAGPAPPPSPSGRAPVRHGSPRLGGQEQLRQDRRMQAARLASRTGSNLIIAGTPFLSS
jgi:hypothetical protein